MPDEAMVCKCCGLWKVTARNYVGRRPLLRITYNGTIVQDVYTVDEVEAVLNRYGIDIGVLEAV